MCHDVLEGKNNGINPVKILPKKGVILMRAVWGGVKDSSKCDYFSLLLQSLAILIQEESMIFLTSRAWRMD